MNVILSLLAFSSGNSFHGEEKTKQYQRNFNWLKTFYSMIKFTNHLISLVADIHVLIGIKNFHTTIQIKYQSVRQLWIVRGSASSKTILFFNLIMYTFFFSPKVNTTRSFLFARSVLFTFNNGVPILYIDLNSCLMFRFCNTFD